jgi:transketolase
LVAPLLPGNITTKGHVNGLALAKLRAFGSGFLIFGDYGKGSLRLSAIMELRVIYMPC